MAKTVTNLGFALLGLINQKPRSGYALRKVFETTPMGSYSSSPGSIYPALESLRKAGLAETRGEGRGKGLFHLTPEGSVALHGWLSASVSADDLGEAMLRFVFLRDHPNRSLTVAFLDSFEAVTKEKAESLRQFLESETGRAMPIQARVAVEHGRRTVEASAAWAAWARQILDAEGELE